MRQSKSDSERRQPRRMIDLSAKIALVVIGIPFVYVLMLGPVVFLYDSAPPRVQKFLEYVYAPLEVVDKRLPGEPISQYAELWRPK